MSVLAIIQERTYKRLIQTTAECVSWASVEGTSLIVLRQRLIQTEQQAEKVGLSRENIRLALQMGEYQGRFGM